MSRSNSRNEGVMSMSMSGALGGDLSGLKRTRSLRVSTGDRGRPDISSLNSSDHTVETEDTQFIRAATGRGSIKRGPAPTKASVLRAQVYLIANIYLCIQISRQATNLSCYYSFP